MRTRRCASTARSVDLSRKPSTPRSRSRGTAAAAVSVCSVVSTRWPVSAACTATCAVSESRISPTMITSGSWRTKERSAEGQSDRRLDLRLVDAGDLVFDGILDGQDLADRLVEDRQHGGQGRGFGPGGGGGGGSTA